VDYFKEQIFASQRDSTGQNEELIKRYEETLNILQVKTTEICNKAITLDTIIALVKSLLRLPHSGQVICELVLETQNILARRDVANFELEKRTVDLSDKSAGLIRMLSNVLADAGVTLSWINRYKETLAPKTAVNISSVREYKRNCIENFANKGTMYATPMQFNQIIGLCTDNFSRLS